MLCDSKAEAKRIDTDLRLKNLGMSGMNSEYSIAEMFASYLETESAQKMPASRKADAKLLKIAADFLQNICDLRFAYCVSVEHLQRFQIFVSSELKWSDTTVALRMKTLRVIFKKAFIHGRIPKDPGAHWSVPRGTSAARRPMTRDEFTTLIQIDPFSWLTDVLLFMRLTGARGASVADLKWSDVDFSTATLLLRTRKGALKKIRTTPFPMYPELFNLLSRMKGRIPRHLEFVFIDHDNQPLTGHRISIAAHRLIKRAGLKGVVLYGLRHALATDLIEAGVPTEIARKALGHSNINQIQTYTQNVGIESVGKSLTLIRGENVIPLKKTGEE